jgi:hypothetical protein
MKLITVQLVALFINLQLINPGDADIIIKCTVRWGMMCLLLRAGSSVVIMPCRLPSAADSAS